MWPADQLALGYSVDKEFEVKLKRTSAAVVLSMAVAIVGVTGTQAQATNRVTCGTRTDWFRVFNYLDENGSYSVLCFANSGYLDTNIYDVDEVDTGNNEGEILPAGTGDWWYIADKNETVNYLKDDGYEIGDVIELHIDSVG